LSAASKRSTLRYFSLQNDAAERQPAPSSQADQATAQNGHKISSKSRHERLSTCEAADKWNTLLQLELMFGMVAFSVLAWGLALHQKKKTCEYPL
jgi:hypothetical protein